MIHLILRGLGRGARSKSKRQSPPASPCSSSTNVLAARLERRMEATQSNRTRDKVAHSRVNHHQLLFGNWNKCWKWWRTVMCDGSILSCCPRNPHEHERVLKEKDIFVLAQCSYICQGIWTRRKRRDPFGHRVKLPPVTTCLTTQCGGIPLRGTGLFGTANT